MIILPSYIGIVINCYKDPYKTTSTMESRSFLIFFVTQLKMVIPLTSLVQFPPSSYMTRFGKLMKMTFFHHNIGHIINSSSHLSGDSWMYPYQCTPMGKPDISPI